MGPHAASAAVPLDVNDGPKSRPSSDAGALSMKGGHVPALDGVRGIAILMVLLVHFLGSITTTNVFEDVLAHVAGYGLYGVDLFFVLSGYLITGLLVSARERPNYFRDFYARRILRIFPLYYGFLLVLLVVLPALSRPAREALSVTREHQVWAWLYGVNVFNAIQGVTSLPYINHFWSLAVEEHFYLLWPLFIWLCPRDRLVRATAIATVIGIVVRLAARPLGVNATAAYVLTPFRLDLLCLGGFIAAFSRSPGGLERLRRWTCPVTVMTAGAFFGAFALQILVPAEIEVWRTLRGFTFGLLLAVLVVRSISSAPTSRLRRGIESAPLRFLGKYSYGLYVFHAPLAILLAALGVEQGLERALGVHLLAVLVQAVIGIGLSIVVAFLSYHLFERHFLALKVYFSSEATPARGLPIGGAGLNL